MGMFRVEVQGVGAHGCQRTIKSGEQVQNFCGSMSCPDCITREYVRQLKRAGVFFEGASDPIAGPARATITHWPGQACHVVDDILTGTRHGNF